MPPEFGGKWITKVSSWERSVLTPASQAHSAYAALNGIHFPIIVLLLQFLVPLQIQKL